MRTGDTIKSETLVQKLWNYCTAISCGTTACLYTDYVEQLTFLLFLKMADERSKPLFLDLEPLPKGFDWRSLLLKNLMKLRLEHYEKILRKVGAPD